MPAHTNVAAIPDDVREFLDFFDEALPDVKFPDVDRESLAALVADVRDRSAELERLSAQVRAAHEALDSAQAELRRAARRGLAYAGVYADGDRALAERLGTLSLGHADGEARPSPRARKPRAKGRAASAGSQSPAQKPTAELPFATESAPEEPTSRRAPSVAA